MARSRIVYIFLCEYHFVVLTKKVQKSCAFHVEHYSHIDPSVLDMATQYFTNCFSIESANCKPDRNYRQHAEENEVGAHDAATSYTNEETIHTIHNSSCRSHESRNSACPKINSPAKVPLSVCETHVLHENILAAHQGETLVIGSIDTWTEAPASEALLSSTPADALLCESVKPSFGDAIQRLTDFGNSPDSGLLINAKDPVCAHQVLLSSLQLDDVLQPVLWRRSSLGTRASSRVNVTTYKLA